ncbi:MAG: aminotransferase class I/II-fold pyridoxal phosphate-dependent enzyme [Microbacterium sp.]|nr:aminotransferase class I/II-fold pyridoxal phosphate-dependent enzyme [Microbacterium sp.]
MTEPTAHAEWDALTADELRRRGGLKWSDGDDVLAAWVAEMDFGTAPAVTEALAEAASRHEFGYATPAQIDELAEATAQWFATRYGWAPPASAIRPLPDVVVGLLETLRHFSNPVAAVVVPTPAYMPFLFAPPMLGRQVRQVPMIEDEWGILRLDLAAIDAELDRGADVVILANPANPAGRVYEREELDALARVADSRGARVFSDEIHAPLTLYGAQHVPFASVSETAANVAVTATSASKAWNLAGLKAAELVLTNPADLERWARVGMLTEHGASTPGIRAHIAAYRDGDAWLGDVIRYVERNDRALRERMAERLPLARIAPLQGTYLAWIDLTRYGVPDDPAEWLLDTARVHVNGGTVFGSAGAGRIRFNLAMPRPLLIDAVDRIADAVTAQR